jgi:hypothetical protein
MSWEHTDISMAPRVGRIDELRDQATHHRQVRDLINQNRIRRVRAIRSRFAQGLASVANRIAPTDQPTAQALTSD